MEWETIIRGGRYVNTGSPSVYECIERVRMGEDAIHAGNYKDGRWIASFSGSSGAINIDVDNMDAAKAMALMLYKMR